MSNELIVNTYWPQWQSHPDIARLTDGSFVVVWDSFFSENGSSVYYIAAQRYAANGTPIGGETVMSDLSLEARYSRITALDDGGYALGWQASQGSILNETDVYTRTFDADGTARGPSFEVNFATSEDVFAAETIAISEGYMVIYTQDRSGPLDNEVWLRTFDQQGRATGTPIKVNNFRNEDDFNARAELLSNGNVIVIWDREELFGPDGIDGRIYRPDGTPVTGQFTITDDSNSANGALNLTNANLSVVGLSNGRFVVTHNRIDIIDGEFVRLVLGQIFNPNGTPAGPEFVIDVDEENEQEHTSVAALPGGGFVVVWDVWSKTDTRNHFENVYAQVFNDFGQPIGDQITVPIRLLDSQEWPSVVALSGGRFAITYESRGLDGDAEGIALRIFDVPDGYFDGLIRNGTAGRDRLEGDFGDDILRGFAGRDVLNGRDGDDLLVGGAGNDTLNGGRGRDDLRGGSGNDTLKGGQGQDDLQGGRGKDNLIGGGGRDQLAGGGGKDALKGGRGDDRLSGNTGGDSLKGGGGEDRLKGGGGLDRLIGGADQDKLTGGGGSDFFVFKSAADAGTGRKERDIITDFSRKQGDVIDLKSMDAKTGSGNQAFEFIGQSSFSDTKGELRVKDMGRDLLVMGDRNGDGRADFHILVKGLGRLTEDDFLL